MRKKILVIAVGIIAVLGSCSDEVDPELEVTPETSEKIEEAQDVNIELEKIDGELDSLLNLLD